MRTLAVENKDFSAFLDKIVGASDFPSGSCAPSADELNEILVGGAFSIDTASTGTFCMEFEDDGSFSVLTGGGYRNSGQWRCEHGILCTTTHNLGRVWSPVRVDPDTGSVYLKWHTGEIVRYVAQ